MIRGVEVAFELELITTNYLILIPSFGVFAFLFGYFHKKR